MEREIMSGEKKELEGYRRALVEIQNSNLSEETKALALDAVSSAIFELERRIEDVTRALEEDEAYRQAHGFGRTK